MQIQVVVCDVDQQVGVPTKQYTITDGDGTVTVDLCDEHGAWLDEMLAQAQNGLMPKWTEPTVPAAVPMAPARSVAKKTAAAAGTASTPARARGRSMQVKTLAQIEREKKAK